MSVRIVSLSPEAIDISRARLVEVYLAAFAAPPYRKTLVDATGFGATLPRHSERSDFRLLAACEPLSGLIVGFTYGYRCQPGQWWHDVVRSGLPASVAEVWMRDAFELAELAVHPRAQGQGIGALLHDTLMGSARQQTALLSTAYTETVALRLYRRRGWLSLADRFYFPGVADPYRILGLRLPLEQRAEPRRQ